MLFRSLIKGLAELGEAYMGVIGWEVIGSFDVLISMMCRTVCHALDKLTDMVKTEGLGALGGNDIYQSCRILVTVLGDALGCVLFLQELFNMGTGVLMFYGALKERKVIFLTAFFMINGVALTIRIYLLYLPMANVYIKSTNFKQFVDRELIKMKLQIAQHGADGAAEAAARRPDTGVDHGTFTEHNRFGNAFTRLLVEKKVSGFQSMVFMPWGFHRITTKSIADYILAMCSYLVTVKKV